MKSGPATGGFRMSNLRGGQDLLAGVMFMLIGIGGVVVGRELPMGTPIRLGTGVFPMILSWGLVVIGAIVALKGVAADGPRLDPWALRPLVLITLAIVAFSQLIDRAGLLVAMVSLMILCALGSRETRLKEFLIFSAILIVAAYLMFITGLELPIRMFPWN